MEAKGIKQLPVVKRGREPLRERKRRIVAILHYDSILNCLRFSVVLGLLILFHDTSFSVILSLLVSKISFFLFY